MSGIRSERPADDDGRVAWLPAPRGALLARCLPAFPGVKPFKDARCGRFLAHHVAIRFTYDARESKSIPTLMNDIAVRLESNAGDHP